MMRLDISMTFSRSEPLSEEHAPAPVQGSIKASGRHITVTIDSEEPIFDASKSMLASVRTFAEGLANRGVSMTVVSAHGEMVSIGDVSAPVSQRPLTRSKWIRIESLRALSRMTKRRSKNDQSSSSLLPPPTLWPLVPTVNRQIETRVTTTHHTRGSGRPRLRLVKHHEEFGPGPLLEFDITEDRTVIGSSESCDLQLSGIAPEHAEIVHDGFDEYVLSSRGAIEGSVNPESNKEVTLRTGSRVHIGPWRIVFFREEYADHGRPFGGRQGGEFSYQQPQFNPYERTID